MTLCKSCRYFKPGTLGPGWCGKENKAVNPKDEACISRVRRYKKHTPKLTPTTLDRVL